MKITVTYKDDVFRVCKDGKETYTRPDIAAHMQEVALPISAAFTFLLMVEAEVRCEDVKKAIAALLETGTYSFNL